MPGRLHGDGAGPALADTDVTLGAGWGGTATATIDGNDQRGQIEVTASATTPDQATATVSVALKRKFRRAPFLLVVPVSNTSDATGERVIDLVSDVDSFGFKAGVLPVATEVYTYNYFLLD